MIRVLCLVVLCFSGVNVVLVLFSVLLFFQWIGDTETDNNVSAKGSELD